MSSQPCYWILACESDPSKGREGTYSILKSRVQDTKAVDFTAVLDVPLNLKYGRFDDLIRLADDLPKQDTYCENACRRFERMGMELDPQAEFNIFWQRNSLTVEQYLGRFVWDDSKYPRNRLLKETVDQLVASVVKLDEEVRVKSAVFNEVKQSSAVTGKKETLNFIQRDLTDVLAPDVVDADDFVETEHLKTLVCVVPKSEVSRFTKEYEKWGTRVVPSSMKKFPPTDRDGACLFRVVLLKDGVDDFKTDAKAAKVIAREFKYSETGYAMKQEERTRIEAEKSKQENVLSRICYAAFSEAFIAWVHIKAIRTFVESTLRYGVPANFSAYLIRVTSKSREARVRKELDTVFVEPRTVGRQFLTSTANKAQQGSEMVVAGVDMDDDYFGYVSLELQPFQQYVNK